MSITRFQNFMQKGCGPAIMFFCALVFAFFAFSNCGQGRALQGGEGEQGESPTVATIAGSKLTSDAVQQAIQATIQKQSQNGAEPTPIQQAQISAQVLQDQVNSAAIMAIAQQDGVSFTDAALSKAIEDETNQQIQMARLQMTFSKELPQNATEQDFEAAFKKKTGLSLDEAKKRLTAQVEAAAKDKDQRGAVLAHYAQPLIIEALKARMNPTDEELKQSFDSYVVERILFSSAKGDADANVQKAINDIKGGLSFEQAMDRYSNDVPQPGKKLSQSILTLSAAQIDSDPSLKALRGLKAGQTSPVVTVPEGKAIYKVVKVTSAVPPDFEKNKARYRDQLVQTLASEQLRSQLDQFTHGNSVQWSSPGYKALYDYAQLASGSTASSNDAMEKIYQEAKTAASTSQGFDRMPAVLAEYAAFDGIWNSPQTDKKKLVDERISVVNDVLQVTESPSLHLELVSLYAQQKQGEKAFEQLLSAAQMNHDTSTSGQKVFSDVAAETEKLHSAGVITAAQVEQVQKEQDRWKKEKTEADKAQADIAKEQAKELKEQAEQEKKNQAPAPSKPPSSGTLPKPGQNTPGPTKK